MRDDSQGEMGFIYAKKTFGVKSHGDWIPYNRP
jgi:hypothetical protein